MNNNRGLFKYIPWHSVPIGSGVEVDIHECLWDRGTRLRVVVIGEKLRCIDILVEGAVEINFDGYIRRKVELRVEGASTVASLDALGSRKLPHVRSTCGWTVKALLDAVAFILDQRESQVDFSHNTRHVKSLDIWPSLVKEQHFSEVRGPEHTSDTPAIANIQVAADALLRVIVIGSVIIAIIAISGNDRAGKSAWCKQGGWEENCGDMHFDGGRLKFGWMNGEWTAKEW